VIVTGAGSTVTVLDADSTADAFGAAAVSAGLVTGTALTAEAVTVAFACVRAAGAFFGVGAAAMCVGSAAICDAGASTVGSRAICDDDS
jgi:hypothetical protein